MQHNQPHAPHSYVFLPNPQPYPQQVMQHPSRFPLPKCTPQKNHFFTPARKNREIHRKEKEALEIVQEEAQLTTRLLSVSENSQPASPSILQHQRPTKRPPPIIIPGTIKFCSLAAASALVPAVVPDPTPVPAPAPALINAPGSTPVQSPSSLKTIETPVSSPSPSPSLSPSPSPSLTHTAIDIPSPLFAQDAALALFPAIASVPAPAPALALDFATAAAFAVPFLPPILSPFLDRYKERIIGNQRKLTRNTYTNRQKRKILFIIKDTEQTRGCRLSLPEATDTIAHRIGLNKENLYIETPVGRKKVPRGP